ncbi:hypothetical protein HOG98_04945 [bacterium]|nr:hypothetical protein [bacterium]
MMNASLDLTFPPKNRIYFHISLILLFTFITLNTPHNKIKSLTTKVAVLQSTIRVQKTKSVSITDIKRNLKKSKTFLSPFLNHDTPIEQNKNKLFSEKIALNFNSEDMNVFFDTLSKIKKLETIVISSIHLKQHSNLIHGQIELTHPFQKDPRFSETNVIKPNRKAT